MACIEITKILHILRTLNFPSWTVHRYILAYIEQHVGVKRGQRLWQLGFGGGFKANSAVWRACRHVRQSHACWNPHWPTADPSMLKQYD